MRRIEFEGAVESEDGFGFTLVFLLLYAEIVPRLCISWIPLNFGFELKNALQ